MTTSYRRRWLDVDDRPWTGRLLTAQIPRVRAVYTFNSRSWLRLIGEWNNVDRHPSLHVRGRFEERRFRRSAVFAYKLNWQTVLFLGYLDGRQLDGGDKLQAVERQGFFKISYAFRG